MPEIIILILFIVLIIVFLVAVAIERKLAKKPDVKQVKKLDIKPPTLQELKLFTEYRDMESNMKKYPYSPATYEYYIREHYGEAEAEYLAKRDWQRDWQHKLKKFIEDNFESYERFREVYDNFNID